MRVALAALLLFIITPSFAASCQSEEVIVAQQEAKGVVTWLTGDTARQVVSEIWRNSSKPAPEVDKLIVTIMYDGSVSLIPVQNGKVCVVGLSVSHDALKVAMAKVKL